MRGEPGQATVEWTTVVLVVALALGGAAYLAATLDAPWLARALRCAILTGCRGEDARLEAVYGSDAAAFVRAYAPGIVYERRTLTLPVDFRGCRSHRCSDGPDLRRTDVAIGRRPAGHRLHPRRRPAGERRRPVHPIKVGPIEHDRIYPARRPIECSPCPIPAAFPMRTLRRFCASGRIAATASYRSSAPSTAGWPASSNTGIPPT